MTRSRFQLPRGYAVRYDYHPEPRGISAIVLRPTGGVASVGFAKFNPRDAQFSVEVGKGIALGRALSKLPRHLTRHEDLADVVDRVVRRNQQAMAQRVSGEGVNHDRLVAMDPSRSLVDELF